MDDLVLEIAKMKDKEDRDEALSLINSIVRIRSSLESFINKIPLQIAPKAIEGKFFLTGDVFLTKTGFEIEDFVLEITKKGFFIFKDGKLLYQFSDDFFLMDLSILRYLFKKIEKANVQFTKEWEEKISQFDALMIQKIRDF
jgi:hypothetical protein